MRYSNMINSEALKRKKMKTTKSIKITWFPQRSCTHALSSLSFSPLFFSFALVRSFSSNFHVKCTILHEVMITTKSQQLQSMVQMLTTAACGGN